MASKRRPSGRPVPRSAGRLKLASQADAAVVAVGFNGLTESEGLDSTFELPWGQDELIQAVAAANKNTIVTVTAGGDISTSRSIGFRAA